ncbi:MAG: hypothetical protein ACK53L_27660, partial [Pirellulaceae bacterium]
DDVFISDSYGASDNLDGGTGNDILIVDYSTYGTSGGAVGGTGISNFIAGKIHNAIVSGWTTVTYSNVEQFSIVGSPFDDKLKARAGDILNGGSGIDTLSLDLLGATTPVSVDLTQTNNQVSFGGTQIQNFELVDRIETGASDDSIRLSTTASRTGGTVDGGAGKDILIVDYSTYGTSGGAVGGTGISNFIAGKIHNAIV